MPARAPGWLLEWTRDELAIEETEVGPLHVPSGRVVACDPLIFLKAARPFERTVDPGDYPVVLGRVDGDVVLASIRFAKRKVARFAAAPCEGDAGDDGPIGYRVDSGAGGFIDGGIAAARGARDDELYAEISAELKSEGVDADDAIGWQEALQDKLEARGEDLLVKLQPGIESEGWAAVDLDDDGGNLVAFASPAGNVLHASWWGLDSRGRPVCLVTDLGLIEDDSGGADDDEYEEDDLSPIAGGGAADDLERMLGDVLAGALSGEESSPEPEPEAPVSEVFIRVRELIDKWVREEKLELEPGCKKDHLAEGLLELLAKLDGHRHVGSHVAEWLLERRDVADLFASDDDLDADFR